MQSAAPIWAEIAAKYNLVEPEIDRLVSWWHTDADLGREVACINDMSNSRRLGFTAYQRDNRQLLRSLHRPARAAPYPIAFLESATESRPRTLPVV